MGVSFFGHTDPIPLLLAIISARLSLCLKFLLSTSRPRWPHCSGSEPTFAHGLLLSNRINTHMSAAPLSPASALSSLQLHWSASLSTSSLSLAMFYFSALSVLAIAAQFLFAGVDAAALR